MIFMSDSKDLQKINTEVLDAIHEVYVSNIEEIKQYYPENIKEKFENLSEKAKTQIVTSGRRMTSGIKSSIPMLCKDEKCCLSSICALHENGIAPKTFPCPYEELMVDKLTTEYYKTLDIDPFNRIERDQVKQLVELAIIENRANADIAKNGLYTLQSQGCDNKGRPIFNEVESLAYGIKLKTQTKIQKIQNELLATRKIKKQLEVDNPQDPSTRASDLLSKYKELKEAKVKIIDDNKTDTDGK